METDCKVLCVIPTLNEAKHLTRVVEQLLRGTAGLKLNIVVADGGSRDRTRDIAQNLARRFGNVQLMPNPGKLQSCGVNAAARRYGHDAEVIIRADAHAHYPAGYCRSLVDTLQRTGADAVVVPLDSDGDTAFQQAVAWTSDSLLGNGGSRHRGGVRSGFVDHGHHAAFRSATFLRVGGYDPSFSHNEDAELDCRQRALGARIYLDAAIRVGYRPRASVASLFRQYFNYGRGRSRTVRRHPKSLRMRQLAVPAHLAIVAAAVFMCPWTRLGLLWPASYAAIVLCVALGLSRRVPASVQSVRRRAVAAFWCTVAALVMHVGWGLGFFAGIWQYRERVWQRNARGLRVWLVDPSLFTAPYDAALTGALLEAGVDPMWAVRPTRPGDRQELPEAHVDAFFYRSVERLSWLPRSLFKLCKGLAHGLGLGRLLWRCYRARPDVVHFQWSIVPLLDSLAIALLRLLAPVVFTVHDSVPYNGQRLSWLQTWGYRLPWRLSSRLIVHTSAGRESLICQGISAEKITIIPHGPLALPVAPKPAQLEPKDARYTFVLFGELKPYKGCDIVVEALGRLPNELRSKLRVLIAGRPQMDLAPLTDRIQALGLGGVVDVHAARLSEQEMANLFADADCFLMPYRQIDASGVYFLVKSLGKWLIASRIGVFAEDVREGEQGSLVPPADPAALALAMARAVVERPVPRPLEAGAGWRAIGISTYQLYRSLGAAEPAAEEIPA